MSEQSVNEHTACYQAMWELENAQAQYTRHPSYETAVALRKARLSYEHCVKELRSSFHVIEGDGGFHDLSELEIAIAALVEVRSALELETGPRVAGTMNYAYKVVSEALRSLGR